MRLFTGISIEPEILSRLENLRHVTASLNWSPPANLHITTKFIGRWPERNRPVLEQALAEIPSVGAIRIQLLGLAFLGSALVAGVAPDPALMRLAEATGDALAAIGCPKEAGLYQPHLTLARSQGKKGKVPRATFFGSFEAKSFHLYLSKAGEYTILRTYPTC